MPEPFVPYSAAAERNKGPILQVLQQWLPAQARVLEIASGTGQHAAHFAAAHPQWTWQPTEADATLLSAIAQGCRSSANVLPPLLVDVTAGSPTLPSPFDAVYCANLLHIAPWPVCAALMRCAHAQLTAHGLLAVYGPFIVDGRATAPSNLEFDAALRARNPAWGLRRLRDVQAEAAEAGLALTDCVDMPANNLLLAFKRAPA